MICDAKLDQRLLYYTTSDLCLSDEDKYWHYHLLVTLREHNATTGEEGHQRLGKHGCIINQERSAVNNPEHNRLFIVEDRVPQVFHGRQRLALGLLPNGARPKAHMLSRVSVPTLWLRCRLGLGLPDCLASIPPCTWMTPDRKSVV